MWCTAFMCMPMLKVVNIIFLRCKKDWVLSELSEKEKEILYQCKDINQVPTVENVEEIIVNSKKFPVKFPIDTVRCVCYT